MHIAHPARLHIVVPRLLKSCSANQSLACPGRKTRKRAHSCQWAKHGFYMSSSGFFEVRNSCRGCHFDVGDAYVMVGLLAADVDAQVETSEMPRSCLTCVDWIRISANSSSSTSSASPCRSKHDTEIVTPSISGDRLAAKTCLTASVEPICMNPRLLGRLFT